MAQYKVQAPDGSIITVEGPDGASDDEVISQAQRLWSQEQQKPTQQQAPQQEPGLGDKLLRQLGLTARMGYEAFTAPAAAVLEAGKTAYNLAVPEGSQLPSIYEAQNQALRSIGVPEPQTMIERGVQAGGQAMLGTAGLARAAPNIPTVAGEMSRQIPAAGVAGLTSVPAAEITKEMTGSDLAATLAGVGLGMLTAGGTAKTIASIESGKTPLLTTDQVRRRATQSYRKVDETGITVRPESVNRMMGGIRQALSEARMVEGTDVAREINARVAAAENLLQNNRLDFNTLDKARGFFNDLRSSKDADLRRLSGIATGEIDNYLSSLSSRDLDTTVLRRSLVGKEKTDSFNDQVGNAVKSLVSARKDWRNATRANVLEEALNTAEARALDPKASEGELIRRGFINIAADKTKMKMFSKEEQNIIKSVASGGSTDKILSLLARFSPLRSQLTTAGTAYTAAQSPALAGIIAGTGITADVLQGQLRKRAAEQAVRRVASGQALRQPISAAERGLFTGIFGPYEQE